MNNVKKNRTGLKLLGSGNNNYRRFTMNKTQQNQPVYSNVQPRCPGVKGQRAGQDCSGSNTNVGCKTCWGCTYTFDVSSNAFLGGYPSYGSFININPVVDSSSNPPCEWQYNGIVEGFSLTNASPFNATVQISIEDNKCINANSITGVYFYAPVGGNNGTYVNYFRNCSIPPVLIPSNYLFSSANVRQSKFVTTAKRMGAPYRNPIAGWRNSLDCNYKDCSGGVKGGAGTSYWNKKQPTNTIYKDNYSGPKSNCSEVDSSGCGCCPKDCTSHHIVHRPGIEGRTHRPIIRSGMQEKRPCCRDSNGKCNKTNDYSFSYWQYKHNKRCLDYERNQEKYVTDVYPACITGRDGKQHCQNAYRKASCCNCCKPCVQVLKNTQQGFTVSVGETVTQVSTGASGTITVVTYTGTSINLVTIQNDDCDILFDASPVILAGPYEWTDYSILHSFPITNNCPKKAMSKTIYKPSNKKFSHQGAVTSGGRLERLKLDTIKSANSKCTKNAPRKCITIPSKFAGLNKVYKYPNGKYGAGKPRFTGWMFNGHHSEVKGRVYNMGRYNQQPLGIPQLTAHPPGKTCIKQCFPRTLDLGSNRSTAAGNRARIPGSKCSVDYCVVKLHGNGGSEFSYFVPGSIVYQPSTGWTGTILDQTLDDVTLPLTWGWLTVQWNGHGICQKPALTTGVLSDATHLEIVGTIHFFKIATATIFSATKNCGCTGCNNDPNYTNQGVPCC